MKSMVTIYQRQMNLTAMLCQTQLPIFFAFLLSELSLAGVLRVLRNLGALLTLFQPEGADYAHHITGSTPGFGNLTIALVIVLLVE